MPMITITLSGATPEPKVVRTLQAETTRMMREILHKDAALTVVNVLHIPSGCSSAHGEAVDIAASMHALITAGTNSAPEKAAFMKAAHALLTAAIGATAAPVYIVLHEIPAESWGYDGESQAARKAGQLIGGAA